MEDEKEKIKPEDIRIEIISYVHSDKIKEFQTYVPDLKDFLIEDALDKQEKYVSLTYLWFNRVTDQLLGYITLMSDSLSMKKIDPSLKEELKLKGIDYPTLPALKIGRLCIDDRFRKMGIGTLMIHFTISIVEKMNKLVGCRFITLDAKENKEDQKNNSVHFYIKNGFKFLIEKKKEHPPMYFDTFKLLKALDKP